MSAMLLALTAGGIVGLSLGALGGGGSVLAVPALIYLLDFTPADATTAALIIVVATSVTGVLAHARNGRVRWRTGLPLAVAGLPTAALAGLAGRTLPGPVLTAAFAVIATVAAQRMFVTAGSRTCTDPPPTTNPQTTTDPQTSIDPPVTTGPPTTAGPPAGEAAAAVSGPGAGKAVATGAGLGAVTGFLGVGGGFLAVPALVSVLGVAMAEAVGTSLLIITANSAAALTARLGGTAELDWMLVGPFAATAILGAWDGRRLAARVSGPALQRIFAAVLLAVALVMLFDAISAIT